jgi:hypothetical protein
MDSGFSSPVNSKASLQFSAYQQFWRDKFSKVNIGFFLSFLNSSL